MRKLILAASMAIACLSARAQMVAVSTDVLMDLCMSPSLGAELVVGERTSISVNAFANHKPWGMDMGMIVVQPEWRYYFSGRPMHRFFVGVGGVGASYDITLRGKVYDGSAIGAGLTFGYVLPIGKRLNIDFHAGFGAIAYRHREYFEGDNYEQEFSYGTTAQANATGYVLMPTRIGVSLAYILK